MPSRTACGSRVSGSFGRAFAYRPTSAGGLGAVVLGLIGYFVLGIDPSTTSQIVSQFGGAGTQEQGKVGTPEDWKWPPGRIDHWGLSKKDTAKTGPAEQVLRF